MSTHDSPHHRFGPRDRGLRAGDGDRESVAEILRAQHSIGRIDTEEFQERLDRCYAAKTYAELDELLSDLPVSEEATPEQPVHHRRWQAVPIVLAVLALVALSHGHLFWLVIPLLFFLFRPMMWRSRRRFGWSSCGTGSVSSRTYL